MASRQSADHDHGGRIRNSNHADGRRQRRRDWRRKRRCNYRADDRRKNGIKRLARYAQRGPVRAAPKGGQPRGCHGGRSSGGGGGNVGEGLEIGHAQRLPIAAFPVKRIGRNPALLIRHGTRGWLDHSALARFDDAPAPAKLAAQVAAVMPSPAYVTRRCDVARRPCRATHRHGR